MKAMRNIAKELTMEDFTLKGDKAIKTAKKVILGHALLRSDFALIYQRQQTRMRADAQAIPNFSYELTTRVYNAVMKKVCNARFGEVLQNDCEQKSLKDKGKINFRASLLAVRTNGTLSSTKESSKAKTKKMQQSQRLQLQLQLLLLICKP